MHSAMLLRRLELRGLLLRPRRPHCFPGSQYLLRASSLSTREVGCISELTVDVRYPYCCIWWRYEEAHDNDWSGWIR